MKGLFYTLSVVFVFTIVACSSAPELSNMQVRQLTAKLIEGSYENVFRASMTILQDQRYVIKNTDMGSGLIVATVDRDASTGSKILGSLFIGEDAYGSSLVEVSVVINKLSETTQELRINIQEADYSLGGDKQDVEQIYDAAIYQKLFNEISLEVKRREALSK